MEDPQHEKDASVNRLNQNIFGVADPSILSNATGGEMLAFDGIHPV